MPKYFGYRGQARALQLSQEANVMMVNMMAFYQDFTERHDWGEEQVLPSVIWVSSESASLTVVAESTWAMGRQRDPKSTHLFPALRLKVAALS